MTMFQHVVLTFVIFGGIVINHIDLLLFSSVTALMISLIVVGAFFYLRPRVALAFFTEVLVLFTISVLLVGLPRNVLVSNLTNGIVAIAIGMTLSVISWRGFAVQYVQTKKILEQQRELEQMAYRDPLTGLPNRRFLDEVIKKEIALIKRGTRNSCVVMIDIDDFKEVNDTYGHPVGDEVLKQLAQLLLENIRESDTLARLGGEEFVILLSDTNCDGAYIVANKLREQIKNHVVKVDGYVVQITASFGVGPLLTSDQGPNYYSLVDKALYKAKSSGKNQIAAARDLFQ
jgi:diguanylate cyclase (GGDEF)-like protein